MISAWVTLLIFSCMFCCIWFNKDMAAFGTFFLRIVLGSTMLFAHGLPKFFAFERLLTRFPDPLGIGVMPSVILVIFAECICSICLILGFATRLVLIPLIITMSVAFFIVHADDPFHKKEMAFLFLNGYVALFFLGTGAYGLRVSIFKTPPKWLKFFLETH